VLSERCVFQTIGGTRTRYSSAIAVVSDLLSELHRVSHVSADLGQLLWAG
jgi:hypothetical protein